MKLYEYEAKEIFTRLGIPVPKGVVVEKPPKSPKDLDDVKFPVAVKAQILAGRRGKRGGILFADDFTSLKKSIDELIDKNIRGYPVKKILIEEKIDIAKEFYLSIIVDRSTNAPLIIVSSEGGIDIEEIKEEEIFRENVEPLLGLKNYNLTWIMSKLELERNLSIQLIDIINKLYNIFIEYDSTLIEINPLALTRDGKFLAIDAKMLIDDSAIWRQTNIRKIDDDATTLEREIKKLGITAIQMDGDIAIIAVGAGSLMLTMDIVHRKGGKVAAGLDIGAIFGDIDEITTNIIALLEELVKPKVLLINLFVQFIHSDIWVKSFLKAVRKVGFVNPMILRLKGHRAEISRDLLEGLEFIVTDSLDEACTKAVSALEKG